MKTEKTVTCHSDPYVYATAIESNRNEKDRCVNCGIRSVPLYLGLDNRLHCADHIGLLLPPDKPEQPAEEEHHG